METLIGSFAAFCTTVSYVPQIWKCWKTGQAGDLSLKMFAILGTGIASWVIYGISKGDPVIIISNSISLTMLLIILGFRIRSGRPKD